MNTTGKSNNNRDMKSGAKGFHAGSEPAQYGPDSVGGGSPSYTNTIGGTPDPNGDRNKVVDKKAKTPKEVSLNAVPMPNKKGKQVNYGVLSVKHDGNTYKTAPVTIPVGGTPMPNTIS